MDIKKISNEAKRKIRKSVRKTKKRISNFELDTPKNRQIFLLIMIMMFAVSDAAIWLSGSFSPQGKEISVQKEPATELEMNARKLASGHPIEPMIQYIVKRDKKVASYVLAIAKKESNLGVHSPKKDGKECFNYWGYRGEYNKTDSGYSCFDSRRQAVAVVSDRIEDLIEKEYDTPREMAVWKCGYNCSWDDPANVDKWVDDVGYYYEKIYQ